MINSKTMNISVLVPCYQEKKRIRACLESILDNDYPKNKIEIIVIDGMSTDGTIEIIKGIQKTNKIIKLICDMKRDTPTARNKGIKTAKGNIIILCDAHSKYPKNYISELVKYHKKNIGDNIGGVWATQPENNTERAKAISAVMSSKTGMGISYRTMKNKNKPLEVDTVPFGSWKKEIFDEVGLFNKNFIRAQDLDHNIRMKKMGKKIILLPWLKIKYYAKGTYRETAKKFFLISFWKNKVNAKHHMITSKRQLFPVGLIFLTLLSVFNPILILPYLFLILYGSIKIYLKHSINPIYSMLAFLTIHYSYGIGYIYGFIYFFILRRI